MERHVAVASDNAATEIVSLARQSEELGFDGFWFTDLRFERDCFTVLGALAMATSRLILAPGVSDPYSRHPAQLAAAIATVQELSGGRAVLGLGAGGSNLDKVGITRERPLSTVETAIGAIRSLLAGDPTTVEANAFTIRDGRMSFGQDKPVPIALVAHGPKMYELAGRLADQVVLANFVAPSGLAWAHERIRRGVGNRPDVLAPVRIVWRVDVCVSEDGARAREFARERTREKLSKGLYIRSFLDAVDCGDLLGSTSWSDAEVDRLVDAVSFAGGPEEIAGRIENARAQSGADVLCCRLDAAPGDRLETSVRLLDEALRGV